MTPVPPPKPRRRWRRWLLRALLAAVVARLLLALFLPQLLAFAAGYAGVQLTVRDASLSLLGLSFRAEDLLVRDADHPEAEPLLSAQEIVFDVATWQLVHGDLGIVDAAVSGARVTVQRNADGTLRLPGAWSQQAPVSAAPPEPTTEPAPPPRFDLPALIASLRVHDLQLHFVDATTAPPRTFTGTLDIDASDLGHRDHAGTVTARIHSADWCDGLWLSLNLTTRPERLDATYTFDLRGVNTAKFALPEPTLAALGGAATLALALQGEVHAAIDPARPRQPDLHGTTQLEVLGDGSELLRADLSCGPSLADDDGRAVPFTFDLIATELARVHVDGGHLHLGREATGVRGELRAEQVTLRRLRPLLQPLGVQWPTAGISLASTFDLELGDAVTATLRDTEFGTADERVALAEVDLRDLRTGSDGLEIGGIRLRGPALTVVRTTTGGLRVAGIERVAAAAPAASAATAPVATPRLAPSLPQLRLGALHWDGLQLRLRDDSATPAAELAVTDLVLRGDALTIGHEAPPGRLTLRARVADAVETLGLDATLTSTASSLQVTVDTDLAGITATSLRPWLQPFGIEPQLRAGRFTASAEATVTGALDELGVRCALVNARFRDGETTLLQLRSLRGEALRFGNNLTSLGAWTLTEPFLAVARDGDGALHALGLRITAPAAPPPNAGPTATTANEPPPDPVAAADDPTLPHGSVQIDRGVLQFRDGEQPPLAVGLDATLDAHDTANGIPFDLVLRLDDVLRQAQLRGRLTPATRSLLAEVGVEGISGSGLARFLPPQVRCTLTDGNLQLRLAATGAARGGTGGSLDITQLQLTDRGERLAVLSRLTLAITALDAERLHIGTLSGALDLARVTLTADGTHVPGLLLRALPAPPLASAVPPPTEASPPAAAAPPLRLPLVGFDDLQLRCERLVVQDRRAGDGEPLVLTAQLQGTAWRADPASGQANPATLQLRASLTPLCADLTATLRVDPYALAPTLDADLDAEGLDLTALQRVLPSLAERVQGTANDAVFTAKLHGSLDLKRRDPRVLDGSRPFAAEFALHDVDFRSAGAERPFAHLGAIEATARAIDPRTGDVLLRSLDIDGPAIDVERTAAGLECLGLRFPPPAAAPAADSAAATASPPAAAPDPAPATGPEFAIDRVQLQGFRATFVDRTTDPATELPIDDGEFTAQRVTSRALTEARAIPFAVTLRGGDVQLPRRILKSSVLAGFLDSATKAITGADDVHKLEARPLFDELRIEGRLQLAPRPTGYVRTMLSGFELPALRGLAKQGGVEIADGTLDQSTRLELRGAQGIDVRSSSVFTWLSLSEPPGGPISTYLRLPAPLDTVLFLLRNDADEQRIPVDLSLPSQGLTAGTALEAVAGALVAVLADAVKSAAGRATNLVTGAIGLGADPTAKVGGTATFAPGDVAPQPCALQAVLDAVGGDAEKTIVLTHELGAGDLESISRLANPPPALVLATVANLRGERSARLAQREPLASELAAHYDAGRVQEARRLQQRLAELDGELGALEQTLAAALRQLAPDPRRARQRVKNAAIELGQARLQAIAARLREAAPNLPAAAIELRSVRAIAVQGLDAGGRVALTVKRRTAQ